MEKVRFAAFHISRLLLAAVFIYAGIVKLYDPEAFYESIMAYRLLPAWGAYISAYFLPPLEILLGLGLFLRRYLKISALAIIFLNIVFIAVMGSAWFRGLDISCGCFGSDASSIYAYDIMRDIAFIILGIFLLSCPEKSNRAKSG